MRKGGRGRILKARSWTTGITRPPNAMAYAAIIRMARKETFAGDALLRAIWPAVRTCLNGRFVVWIPRAPLVSWRITECRAWSKNLAVDLPTSIFLFLFIFF